VILQVRFCTFKETLKGLMIYTQIASEVLLMKISLTPDQISALGREISQLLKGLTNTDAIIKATKQDLQILATLRNRTNIAKSVTVLISKELSIRIPNKIVYK